MSNKDAIRLNAKVGEMLAQAEDALVIVGDAMDFLTTSKSEDGLVDLGPAVATVSRLQDVIARLRDVEAAATRRLGQAVLGGQERTGTLADGRPWTLRRTADRKAWQHDDWKRDARKAVIGQVAPQNAGIIDWDTGEERDLGPFLYEVAAAIQEVHGSTAPRTGVLKALGLDPGNYCETVRGNWKVDTMPASTTTETTTTEG